MDKLIKASNLKLVIEALALLIDNNADVAQAEIQAATELMQPKLIAGSNITIDENNVISAIGSGGGAEKFVVNVTYSNRVYSADKTNAEIYEASQSGKIVEANFYEEKLIAADITSREARFFNIMYVDGEFTMLSTLRIYDDEVFTHNELMQQWLYAGDGITIEPMTSPYGDYAVISATGGSGSSEVVKYTAQTLTTTQQEQACANIGALMQKDVMQNVQDNSKPISAAAVYTTVGNINALLESI